MNKPILSKLSIFQDRSNVHNFDDKMRGKINENLKGLKGSKTEKSAFGFFKEL